jgi:hypothetical protein
VVHVEKGCVRVTYTDVHIQRLLFFQSLFAHWAVNWDDTRSRTDRDMDDGVYHISTGTFTANNEAGLSDYLSFLGSRLVFLIDWNRARKRLRLLLPKKESLAVLKWAADEGIGHMGWLRAGGEQLVVDALAFAARTPRPSAPASTTPWTAAGPWPSCSSCSAPAPAPSSKTSPRRRSATPCGWSC